MYVCVHVHFSFINHEVILRLLSQEGIAILFRILKHKMDHSALNPYLSASDSSLSLAEFEFCLSVPLSHILPQG